MLTRLVERFDPDEFRVREDGIIECKRQSNTPSCRGALVL
jgi:hypothetical protein